MRMTRLEFTRNDFPGVHIIQIDIQFFMQSNNCAKLDILCIISGQLLQLLRRRVQDEKSILQAFHEDPGISVCRVAHELGVSRYVVHHVLCVNGLHTYHY